MSPARSIPQVRGQFVQMVSSTECHLNLKDVRMSASCSLSIRQFTSSEAGAWSNAYLISGTSVALLYDVFMLRSDAIRLADAIERSGKILTVVMISHAHPDHFMGLDVIADRFPRARIVSTGEVVA